MEAFAGGQAAMEEKLKNIIERANGTGGFLEQMDLQYRACSSAEKTLTLSMTPKPWMANPMGVMHGGMVAGVLDTAMGTLSSLAAGGEGRTPTVTMSISYLRPVPLDRPLMVRARLKAAGRTLNHLEAEIWAEGGEDRILATGTGAFFALKR